jgi:hypothetical protein
MQDLFDFIHFRNVAQGITKWPEVLTEAYRCMKPGGYIELTEYDSRLLQFTVSLLCRHGSDPVSVQIRSDDGTLTPDNPILRFGLALEDAMTKSGRVNPSEEQLKTRLEKAGFVNVQAFTVKQPVGPWAKAPFLKKVGLMVLLLGEQAFYSYGKYEGDYRQSKQR